MSKKMLKVKILKVKESTPHVFYYIFFYISHDTIYHSIYGNTIVVKATLVKRKPFLHNFDENFHFPSIGIHL